MARIPDLASLVLESRWLTAEGEMEGRPIRARVRIGLERVERHPRLARRLMVSWTYGDDGRSGLPSQATEAELTKFEGRLAGALQKGNQAVLVAAVTLQGRRDWIFFTSDVAESADRINQAFASDPQLPLALEETEDPEWEGYEDIKGNFLGDMAVERAEESQGGAGAARVTSSNGAAPAGGGPGDVVRRRSEDIIREYGGRVCDWLPGFDFDAPANDQEAVFGRMMAVQVMIAVAFGAPTAVMRQWIEDHGLLTHLSESELDILSRKDGKTSEAERNTLSWQVEGLWAMVWALSLVEDLPFDQPVGEQIASLLPSLRQGESPDRVRRRVRLRPKAELHAMLDLYYRLHWWVVDAGVRNEDAGDLNPGAIAERRRALQWILTAEDDWDHVDMST